MIRADFISNEICAKCVFACAKSTNMRVDKMELASRGPPINQTCLNVAEKLTRESSSRAIIQFCKVYGFYFTLYSDLQNRQRGKTSKTKNEEQRQSDSKLESLSLKWFVVYQCCWIWTPLLFNVKTRTKSDACVWGRRAWGCVGTVVGIVATDSG